jgi:hypothetical protein
MIAQADPWNDIRKLDAKKTAARKPERQQHDAESLGARPLAEKTQLGAADAE